MEEEIISKNIEETKDIAVKVIRKITALPPQDKAVVVTLLGNLGSGKTTFAQFFGKHLGVKDTIQSPTFLIQKNYKTWHPSFKNLIHIDAYRIEDPKELSNLHFNDVLSDPQNIVLIEWPEKVMPLIPDDSFNIKFDFVDEETRKITLPIQLI